MGRNRGEVFVKVEPQDVLFQAFHTEIVGARHDAHLMVRLEGSGKIVFSPWFLDRNVSEQARLLIEYLETHYRFDVEKGRWMHLEQKT